MYCEVCPCKISSHIFERTYSLLEYLTRRVYKCGPHMTLHVATRCGKWYRLWIELEQRPEAAVTAAEYEKYLKLFRQLHRFLRR